MTFEVSRSKLVGARDRIGALALEHGLLSRRELEALLERARAQGQRVRMGELLVRERYVTAPVLEGLLEEQRRRRDARAPVAAPPGPAEGSARPPSPPEPAPLRLDDYLRRLVATRAQELLLMTGRAPALRVPDVLQAQDEPPLSDARLAALAAEVFPAEELARAEREPVARALVRPAGRFRARLVPSEQGRSLSLRPVGLDPQADGIALPAELLPLAALRRGLVLITGGSAVHRASALAKLVDRINETSPRHVITIERDPTYEHRSKRALVAQREVGTHTASYDAALRTCVREDPDALAIGEIRGAEAIAMALAAAETGHLVLCSLHATSPSQALRRLVDVQAAGRRGLALATLANSLQALVTLDVVPGKGGARHLVADALPGTPALARMIREDRLHLVDAVAATQPGAVSRDPQLRRLWTDGKVSRLMALERAHDPDAVQAGGEE